MTRLAFCSLGHAWIRGTRRECPWCHPPTLSALPLRHVILRAATKRGGVEPVADEIAQRLNISAVAMRRTLKRIVYGESMRVTYWMADRIATVLVGGPSEVYGDEWSEASPWPVLDEETD